MENERPTPLIQDTETTRRKLESWLSDQRGHPVHIPALTIPESSGMSNVTLLFDAQWQENGATRSEACVGRLQPEVERPVLPAYDLGLQYEVMASIGRHSDIPVPELRGLAGRDERRGGDRPASLRDQARPSAEPKPSQGERRRSRPHRDREEPRSAVAEQDDDERDKRGAAEHRRGGDQEAQGGGAREAPRAH